MIYETYLPYGSKHNNPNKIIVHAMGEYIKGNGEQQHAVAFLNEYKLSAHALIAPNGDVYLCRKPTEGAYHARGYNTNSLGIEFLVSGEHNYKSFIETIKSPYLTDKQLESGVEVCKQWIKDFDISVITRHSDVSPDRKVDPANGFPWELFLNKLGE